MALSTATIIKAFVDEKMQAGPGDSAEDLRVGNLLSWLKADAPPTSQVRAFLGVPESEPGPPEAAAPSVLK